VEEGAEGADPSGLEDVDDVGLVVLLDFDVVEDPPPSAVEVDARAAAMARSNSSEASRDIGRRVVADLIVGR